MIVERTRYDDPQIGKVLRHSVVLNGVRFCGQYAVTQEQYRTANIPIDEFMEHYARQHLLDAIEERLYKDSP